MGWLGIDDGTSSGGDGFLVVFALVSAVVLLAPALLHRHAAWYRLVGALLALLVMGVAFVGLLIGLTLFLLPAVVAAWWLVIAGPAREPDEAAAVTAAPRPAR